MLCLYAVAGNTVLQKSERVLTGFSTPPSVKFCIQTPWSTTFLCFVCQIVYFIMLELHENMTSSTKPEVHNLLQSAREVPSHNHSQHAQKMKFCRVVFDTMWAGRQTNKQTDRLSMLITILCTHLGVDQPWHNLSKSRIMRANESHEPYLAHFGVICHLYARSCYDGTGPSQNHA